MKTFSLLTTAIALAATASAQDMLAPKDGTVTMDDVTYSGVTVMLEAAPDDVRDAVEDWASDDYDVDFDYKGGIIGRDKDFLVTKEAYELSDFGDRPVYLRARVVESGNGGTELTMFSNYEGNVAIEPTGQYATVYSGLRTFTDEFLEDFVPEYYRSRVATVESSIEDLREDIEGFKEDITDNEETIEELKRENEELRNNITEAERMLVDKGETLDIREDELEEAVDKVSGGN